MAEERDTLPTLDQLAADPALATNLSAAQLAVIAARVASIQQGVAAALTLAANGNGNRPDHQVQVEHDSTLTLKQAATQLSRSLPWLYRHKKFLPFVIRLGPRSYVCSAAGLKRWLAVHKV